VSDTRDIGLSVLTGESELRGRIVQVEKGVLARNAELAQANRKRFKEFGLLVLNVVSSPGSGKTAFLARTLHDVDARAAVIVGDLATDNDAERLRKSGADAVQITTGGVCHFEAAMIARAAAALNLDELELLVIENVGNLVCPAAYDLGEDLRVVLLSVTEGEDKPLKYPKIFKTADIVVITKTDLAEAVDWDRQAALENIHLVAPQALVLEVSARTGAGLEGWYGYLNKRLTKRAVAG
jgi:hydrogenase nickel incorporation protein HypB